MMMSKKIDWKLCIVCQAKSKEDLRCPTRNALDVYKNFLKNVEEFQKINSLPVKIDFGDEGTATNFLSNKASWHKQCHQKFNNSMLECAKLKRKRESTEIEDEHRRPKRQSSILRDICIFCDKITSEQLHEVTTLNVDKSIKSMATEMSDHELLVKISGGDLIALEAKYHLNCLTIYRNLYRTFSTQNAILQNVISFLNPGQNPVMACDCPIFAKAKYVQWTWPTTHGEDRLIVMFGGLHLEMGMWTMLGDYLACSGWTAALTEAGSVIAGKADSFLKATHLTRTRRAHQLACVALEKLQKEAFQVANSECSFEEWRRGTIEKSPTFHYWDTILSLELLILTFIRAHREKNFPLYMYVEALEAIVGYFFVFEHYNHARWVPIHIRDMLSLPDSIKENFMRCWVVSKTKNRFSSIPIDQMHKQENAKVKGIGECLSLNTILKFESSL